MQEPGHLPETSPPDSVPGPASSAASAGKPVAAGPPPDPRRRAVLLQVLGWTLRIALPVGVLFIVWRELSHLDFQTTRQHIRHSDWRWLTGAIAAAFVAVIAMGGYDAFAFRSTPRLGTAHRWARGTLIFAWTNFLGLGPIGGPALRLFFYKRAGMPIPEILRGLVRLYVAFFAGLTAWLAAVFAPVGAGDLALASRLLIAVVLAPLLAIGAARLLYRFRPDAAGPWPVSKTAVLGLLGVVDWGAALAAFALTSRALGLHEPLARLGQTLYFGHAVGVVSMLPGGLGSADAVWLKMLTTADVATESAAAHILLFRVAFYVVPWIASLVGLYVLFTGSRAGVGRWQRRILAGAVALNAGFLLASSATPALHTRLKEVGGVVPLPIVEVSHAASVVGALVMLFLVRGLLRGYRAAFLITATTLAASAVAHILKGGDYEEAVVCLVLFALLIGVRKTFPRQGRIPLGWELTLAVTLGAVTFFVLLGLTAFRTRLHHLDELLLRFSTDSRMSSQAPRFLRAALAMAMAGLIVLVRQAVYPPRTAEFATPGEIDRAMKLARLYAPRTAPLLIAVGDKAAWFFQPGGKDAGVVPYQRRGNTMVVLADPVVQPGLERDLLEALHEAADEDDLHLVFYQISGRWMEHLHDFGYSFFKLGEEAIVHLADFRLEGKKAHGFRKSVRKAEEQGVSFEVLQPPHEAAVIHRARAVSDAWLTDKGVREMQFSLGYFSGEYLQRFPLAIARHTGRAQDAPTPISPFPPSEPSSPGQQPSPSPTAPAGEGSTLAPAAGEVLAFVNLMTARPGTEASFDLMRYRGDKVEGLMDYLIIQTALWAKSQGFATLNLGMSPLYDVGDWKKAALTERLARLLFTHGERVYNYKGLQAFKEKYHPVWEPRYLAFQRPWHWADAVLTSSSLILARTRRDKRRIAEARRVQA